MHLNQGALRLLGAAAVAVSIAACSGGGSGTPSAPIGPVVPAPSPHAGNTVALRVPPIATGIVADKSHRVTRASWLDRTTFDHVMATSATNYSYIVYASNPSGGTIDIYQDNTYKPQSANPPMVGQITGLNEPLGLYVDRSSNLWLIDRNGSNSTIYEYTRGSLPSPAFSFTDPYSPQGLAVGPDGTVYVGNTDHDANGNVGISVYKKGATTSSLLLTDPKIHYAEYPFVDAAGDVYLSYYDINAGSVIGVFKAGSTTLNTFALANQAYDGKLDSNGNLTTLNTNLGTIETYTNGQSSPSSSFVLLATPDFARFDFNYARNQIFSDQFDLSGQQSGSPIYQNAFPGGALIDTYKRVTSYEYGIITAPAAPLGTGYSGPLTGPTASPAPGSNGCSNGANGPLVDNTHNTITITASVTCAGSGGPYNISATSTLYNAANNSVLFSVTGGTQGYTYEQQGSEPCYGLHSYYSINSSNVAPDVRSGTVTSSTC